MKEMTEIEKYESNEVTILNDGSTKISQRKLADLCGVTQQALQQVCLSRKYDVNQGVSEEHAFFLVTYYAIESKAANDTARKTLAAIGAAGMRAYCYQMAGYVFEARPKTRLELAREQVKLLEDLEAAEQKAEGLRIELDDSKQWMTIKKVAFHNGLSWKELSYTELKRASSLIGKEPKKIFDANFPNGVNSYHIDAWRMVYPDLDYSA